MWSWRKRPAKLNELSPPEAAVSAVDASEMLRAWIASSRLQVSVRPAVSSDPLGWGIVLVDAARLVADGLEEQGAGVATVATSQIRAGYEGHWAAVTEKPAASWISVHPVAPGPLPPPPGATKDAEAGELMRVWRANGEQVFVLRPTAVGDPRIWGMLLVDVARSVASAYETSGTMPYDGALARVRGGFEAEWNRPTDTPRKA